jgi:hypothetical protein
MPLRPRPLTEPKATCVDPLCEGLSLSRGRRPTYKGKTSELGRSRVWPGSSYRTGPQREGDEPKPMMNEREKSDPAVVAAKSTNEAGQPGEEWMEPGRGPRGMRPSKARSELSVGLVCHVRWVTYDAPCTCGLVVKHPRWKPDAGKPHVRFCAGYMCPYPRFVLAPHWQCSISGWPRSGAGAGPGRSRG